MRKALAFLSASSLYLSTAVSVFADNPAINIPLEPPLGSVKDVPVQNIPQFVITLLFVVGLIIAIGFLLYGGIRWILSHGDKTKVEEARNHIVAAIVGIVIIAATFVILNIVFTLLTGQSFDLTKNLCIPNLSKTKCN